MRSTRLSYVERRVLVAVLERLRIHEVLEARQSLKRRGVMGVTPYAEPGPTGPAVEDQLSFDRMMRANRAPRATDVELGDTTSTDPGGW